MSKSIRVIKNITFTEKLLKHTKVTLQVNPIEYEWIKNMINALNKRPNYFLANEVFNYKKLMKEFPEIESNGHTGGTISWTISVSRHIINNGWDMKPYEKGLSYALPYPFNKE